MKKTIVLLMLALASSCSLLSVDKEELVVTPTKFGDKVKNLHKTIVIEKAGEYDYEGTMHRWRGEGSCGFLGAEYPVMEIRADNVIVKNFGFKDGTAGIVITDKEGDSQRENVRIINSEGYSCTKALRLPANHKNILIENSIFRGSL